MKKLEKLLTKPEKIARIIYKAIIRYIQAEKSPISEKKISFDVDNSRHWRGNTNTVVDIMEK